jgi:Na+/proline symporter
MKTAEIIITVLYAAIVLWWAISAKKQADKSGSKFFASSKTFGALVAGLAAATTGMSGFGFVGGPGLNYKFGSSVMYIGIFFTVSYGLMMWLNGKPMRMMGAITNIETFADLGDVRYGSRSLRFLIAINLIISIFAYLGAQVLAGGYILHSIFGISVKAGGVALLIFTLIYTVYGGMVGSIKVDFLQAILKLFSMIGIIIGFYYITGGMGHATMTIASSKLFGPQFIDPIGHPNNVMLPLVMSWVFVLAIGVIGQTHVNTKLYSLKSYKDLKTFGLIAGVSYGIMTLLYILPGTEVLYLVASGQIEPFKVTDEAVFHFFNHLPPVLVIMLFAGLLAATMSTSSSFLVIGSSVITRDIPKSLNKTLSQKEEVVWGRWALIILTLGAALFGLYGGYLVALVGVLGLGTFIATSLPVIIGYQWKKASTEAAIISEIIVLIMSIFVSVIYEQALKQKLPGGIPGYAYMILIVFIIMVFVPLFTKGSAGDNLPEKMKLYFKHME